MLVKLNKTLPVVPFLPDNPSLWYVPKITSLPFLKNLILKSSAYIHPDFSKRISDYIHSWHLASLSLLQYVEMTMSDPLYVSGHLDLNVFNMKTKLNRQGPVLAQLKFE